MILCARLWKLILIFSFQIQKFVKPRYRKQNTLNNIFAHTNCNNANHPVKHECRCNISFYFSEHLPLHSDPWGQPIHFVPFFFCLPTYIKILSAIATRIITINISLPIDQISFTLLSFFSLFLINAKITTAHARTNANPQIPATILKLSGAMINVPTV